MSPDKVLPPPPASPRLRQAIAMGALACIFVLMVLMVIGIARVARLTGTVDRNQSRNTAALCALRGDLTTRVASSQAFLRHHPNGIPGISRATILQSVDGQQRTIAALAIVSCPSGN